MEERDRDGAYQLWTEKLSLRSQNTVRAQASRRKQTVR
jgi:hypothetical protein